MAREEWRDVRDYDGIYQVSSEGRVRRITRFRKVADGLFKPCETSLVSTKARAKTGYVQVRLSNGVGKTVLLHRIVCEAFHGPAPSAAHEVGHWDGVRDNNRADNLRWVTKIENAADRKRHGTDREGEMIIHNVKLTAAAVRAIKQEYRPGYGNLVPFAKRYGVTTAAICAVTKGKNWKHI